MAAKPLTERPLDLIYVGFFLCHIPATVFLGMQALYTVPWLPTSLTNLPKLYVEMSRDPLVGSVVGLIGSPESHGWFLPFHILEVCFQFPVFILGTLGLRKDCKKVYILLLIYGASTVTTMLPCLAVLIRTPLTTPETLASKTVSLTTEQKMMLLSSYIPFFLIPLFMTIDMALHVHKLVQIGVRAQHTAKTQ